MYSEMGPSEDNWIMSTMDKFRVEWAIRRWSQVKEVGTGGVPLKGIQNLSLALLLLPLRLVTVR